MMEIISLIVMIVAFVVVIAIDTAQKRGQYRQKGLKK